MGVQFSISLAASAVICFVVGIANPLNLFSTPGTRLSIASVNRHTLTKRGHVFGKASFCLRSQPVYPERKCMPCCGEQPFPFVWFQLTGECDRRQLRGV